MNDDEAVAAVTTEKARAKFVKALDAAEEWLYEGGEDAPAKEHRWPAARPAPACSCQAAASGLRPPCRCAWSWPRASAGCCAPSALTPICAWARLASAPRLTLHLRPRAAAGS